jgi:predicted TIM-barrel fold metal-dependent hydrolase
MRVVDSHFHVWRQADLPWLMGPMQPRIFGPYNAIRRDYAMAEYLSDCSGQGVVKAVYVQANWPADRAADEARFIEQTALETGWPHATVAYADMTVPDARPALDRLSHFPRLRGIRQQLHFHDNPQFRFAAHPDLCDNPNVRKNCARLAIYGLTFDLQVFALQMEGAARLAAACPNTTFVLQHAGMLEDLTSTGRATWGRGMDLLAACPNVVVKLSGFGTFVHRLDRDLIAWLWRETIARFGAQRCLWGSNFPIEKLWTGYPDLLAAHLAAAATLSPSERAAVFHDNACRVYRL